MTGIERLRQMAEDFKNVKTAEHCTFIVNTWRGRYIDDAIADIADQIERETIPREPGDGDVGPKTLHAIALSLLDDWERESVAWVREHGGAGALRSRLTTRLARASPTSRMKSPRGWACASMVWTRRTRGRC